MDLSDFTLDTLHTDGELVLFRGRPRPDTSVPPPPVLVEMPSSRRNAALKILLAVCLAVLLSGMAKAEEVRKASTSHTSSAGPWESVKTVAIRLPVVDGTDIRFARLSTPDGLSQIKVSHILQDDQGFMWFATLYGLNRYDGREFKVFAHDPKDPNSLSGAAVIGEALFKDRDGALWIGCDEILNKFDPATETFTRYRLPSVSHISQDSAGILWLATRGAGLYSLDPVTGRTHQYLRDPDNPLSLSSNTVTCSGEDRAGRFWVATTGYLDEFDRQTGKVSRHILIPDVTYGFEFFEDRFGLFWIFHPSPNPLSVLDRQTNTLTHYLFPERKPPGTAVTRVTAMVEDRNGTLWIGTHGPGLLKFDREHMRFIRYRNDPEDPDSLPQNNVDAMMADQEGSIWVGLGSLGPVRFDTNPLPFTRLIRNPNPHTKSPFVGAIYEDREGSVWVGGPEALNLVDRKAGRFTAYRYGGPETATDVVAIREDRAGNLWVGTYGHGLLRFDRRTGQFKAYRHNPTDPHSLSDDCVTRLLVDHDGTLWAGAQDGLNRFDATSGRFTAYKFDPQEKPFYLEIVEDRFGALWLGTEFSGLRRLDPSTGHFTSYQHEMNRPETLSDDRVNSIHLGRSGVMWVGTQDGLDRFDPQAGRFTVYTKRDGLPGNAIGCILEDGHGDLWMSTNNGVARFNPQSNRFQNYTTADGLPGPNLTGWGACFKSAHGEMFFGGFNGATAFFPDKVLDRIYAPPTVLTDFRLFESGVGLRPRSPLKKSINYTNAITLHQHDIFSIQFSALSYVDPATNRYRYMLEGLDHQWNEVGSNQPVARYNTLPAGNYTFRVQGANSRGTWSEPGVELSVKILPPWWNTRWFRLLCIVTFLALLWTFHKLRLRQLRRRFNEGLEARVQERTRIARELHDTLLQTFHGVIFKLQTVSDQLSEGTTKERLDRAIDQASQAITEGRDAVQDIRSSTEVTNNLTQAIGAIGQELAANDTTRRRAAFRIEVDGTPRDLHPILRDEVYRIAGEALRNAFRHAQARRIEVHIRYEDRQFQLIVRDDGKGLDTPVPNKESRPGHWGLPGMRERAKLIGGKLEVWSKLESGTEIELTIPGPFAYTAPRAPSWSRAFRIRTVTKP